MSPPLIRSVTVSGYTIPTTSPEADGTLDWSKTTLILVELTAGDKIGVGYTYADESTGKLIHGVLANCVEGHSALDIPEAHARMLRMVRNMGQCGVAAMAISAVDVALWDLKAKLLGVSLLDLLGARVEGIAVYGSGGFTSYSMAQLESQLGRWAADGFSAVKMKIGRNAEEDLKRVRAARKAIGPQVALFVDANGAYSRKDALRQAERFAELDVRWFEEPVSSDDLEGLRLMRDRAPAGMHISAGEYGYNLTYFQRMLDAGAVDVLQADATRCCGLTGFLKAGALCEARHLLFSFHCAPALHAAAACSVDGFWIGEYFWDHQQIEDRFFDGALTPMAGKLVPDRSRPGLGLEWKHADAAPFKI